MSLCIICNSKKEDNFIYLTNKSFIHKTCEEILYKEISDLEEIITKRKSNLLYFLQTLFSSKTTKANLEALKAKQKSIYDYWSTYPPDWSKRKEEIKSRKKSCDKCGKTKFRKKDCLQVHHTIPIRDGGSHLDSNLELLCKNCHKIEHLKRPHRVRRNKKKINNFNSN